MFHWSYLFDPYEFHATLGERVIINGTIRLDVLLKWAQRIVDSPTPATTQLLDYLGYHPSWLHSSGEEDNAPRWYMIALSQHLAPLMSLYDESGHITALKRDLPAEGWTRDEIHGLIYGDPLHTLVESSNHPLLTKEFKYGVSQYGGWLSSTRSQELLHRVSGITTEKYWTGGGYAKAVGMLGEAVRLKKAIYIISG